jgi:xylono-1,5-lactonase
MEFELIAGGFQFAEAPCVDDDGTVYFSDLLGGGYYRKRPGGPVETVLPERMWIGGAVLDAGGGVVCAGKGGLVLVHGTGARPLLTEIDGEPIAPVNDIEGDGHGGLFGGTMDFAAVFERGELPRGGKFFHLAPSGEVRVLRDDVTASNGIGFSPDGSLLYHSESTVGIWVWRMGNDGLPHSPELLAPAEDCDGLAVDAEGGIWVAFWESAELRLYRPGGTVDRTISLPFPCVTSLAFGGRDMRDLYITTGGNADNPGRGGVVRIRTDVPGLKAARSRFGR